MVLCRFEVDTGGHAEFGGWRHSENFLRLPALIVDTVPPSVNLYFTLTARALNALQARDATLP